MRTSTANLKYPLFYFIYLLAVWTFYRFSGLDTEISSEFLVKPIVWLLPIAYLLSKEKSWRQSLGITSKNLLPAFYFATALGMLFIVEGILVNYLKYQKLDFAEFELPKIIDFVLISLATAISEELAFRGYIFGRLWKYFENELFANLITSVLWVVIRLPAMVLILGYTDSTAAGFILISLLYSVGACFIYARTKNIFSSIWLYVLWEVPIVLFR